MIYSQPNTDNAIFNFKPVYFNYINAAFTAPTSDAYFDNFLQLMVRFIAKSDAQTSLTLI